MATVSLFHGLPPEELEPVSGTPRDTEEKRLGQGQSAFDEAATWFSDMSKLTAFSTVMQQSGGVRQRPLSDRLSREYFGYLASNSPTSFIFCVNCTLPNARGARRGGGVF